MAGSRAPKSRRVGAVVGRSVRKDFPGVGPLLGKVISYGGRLYKVVYEDGRLEDLQLCQILPILVQEKEEEDEEDKELGGVFADTVLAQRKRKLDQLISTEGTGTLYDRARKNAASGLDGAKASSASRLSSGLDQDAGSSSDSCDSYRAPAAAPTPENSRLLALPLPPSSCDIRVPEEAVPYLLSVYSFLRSFSHRLFLSPFVLDDFVGSLNCGMHNSLMDAVHVSLLRALRHHLETLASDGSQLASTCLRHVDWTLLDNLTWPVFMVNYLWVKGYMKGPDWKELHTGILSAEYYILPVTTKLKVLQILCDDVVESDEFRVELGMRENMEEDKECNDNAGSSLSEGGLPTVQPKHTSACKDMEASENAAALEKTHRNEKVLDSDMHTADVSDWNSDECRLCGMDGILICCDGCPSAYHSRCIGLNRASLPDGTWFCPECMVDKVTPTSSRIGKGIRAAEIFGVDPFERVFLGTCNYLLIVESSSITDPLCRYYNHNDVIKVMRVLCATGQTSIYADILKGISKHWTIPLNFLDPNVGNSVTTLPDEKEAGIHFESSHALLVQEIHNVREIVKGENYRSNITDCSADNRAVSCFEVSCIEAEVNGSLDSVDHVGRQDSLQYESTSDENSAMKSTEASNKTVVSKNYHIASNIANKIFSYVPTKTHVGLGRESAKSTFSHSLATDMSDLSHEGSAERSSAVDFGTRASGNGNLASRDDSNRIVLPAKIDSICLSNESRQFNYIHSGKSKDIIIGGSYVGAFFKPHTYSNQYILGFVAASSAANLAVLASEESRGYEDHVSSNPRKLAASNITLQMKAFSGPAMRFLWPSAEKKLVEVPREKCGWCIACKGVATHKKGCLMNLAASHAIKGAARGVGGLRSIKNSDTNVHVIAAHILHMEESLHGLLVGSLLDLDHNKQWRMCVKEASTCRVLKFFLLELEMNIRRIAFSGGWLELVDNWVVELSAAQPIMCIDGSSQKRGLGGKRNRKSLSSKTLSISLHESWKHVHWWRGGKLSKVLFQKGTLPASLAKKAARQGGLKGVSGVHYTDSPEIPKRSRQIAWRAAVEMNRNASQLALQVRYLDAYIRWRDIVRTEQAHLDGKVADVEASAFRNAVICGKRIAENKIQYALVFANQKHLPLRVMKNIIEEEKSQDQNKLWFFENSVPLYLIKEFEERIEKLSLPSKSIINNGLLDLRRKHLKSCRRDIFSYLFHKEEKSYECACASCQQYVLFRLAVMCNTCRGYCHKDCMAPSVVGIKDNSMSIFLCNLCYKAECRRCDQGQKTMRCDLASQQELMTKATKEFGTKMGVHSRNRTGTSDFNTERKVGHVTYGLIWKKKGQEGRTDFRLNHIILRGNAGMESSRRPLCYLCSTPYNPDLMYIRCEKCLNWLHADAVCLQEDQIFSLVGFKCCKCRRKSSPNCPYGNPASRRAEQKPLKQGKPEGKLSNPPKSVGSMLQSVSETKSELPKLAEPSVLISSLKMKDMDAVEDGPSHFPVENVEPSKFESEIKLNETQSYPQKHSVRRADGDHVVFTNEEGKHESLAPSEHQQWMPIGSYLNHENDICGTTQEANITGTSRNASYLDISGVDGYGDERGCTVVEDKLVDSIDIGIEDMEYEPQTYFTFTELLASENDQADSLLEIPAYTSESWCMTSGFGVTGTGNNAVPSYISEPTEMRLVGRDIVAEDPNCYPVQCEKCKLIEPHPDLVCETCQIHIHSHCSPWVEDERILGDSQWRCGSCRDP